MRWESCARSQINNGKLSKSERISTTIQIFTYTDTPRPAHVSFFIAIISMMIKMNSFFYNDLN